ncbi:recombinase family protein [Pseudomonas sp. JAI115]|uniref:recombinase family protein n=1 Tax=Pseudomonas sp. JAI115 TaxID=2723061 RepID=UPI0021A6B1C0
MQSLNDPIDTPHAQGRLVFNLYASLAEFERKLIRERTQASLSAARARVGGRLKGLPVKTEATAMAAEPCTRGIALCAIAEWMLRDIRKSPNHRGSRACCVTGRASYRAGDHHHVAPGGGVQSQGRACPEAGQGEQSYYKGFPIEHKPNSFCLFSAARAELT